MYSSNPEIMLVVPIIFPYDYKNGKLIRYSTQQFNTQFPGAVNYLNDFREQLANAKTADEVINLIGAV